MKNNSSIKTSDKELYAAVRTEGVLGLIAVLDKARAKHGAMVACDLSEKAHIVFHRETEIRRRESLSERLATYKRQKQLKRHTYVNAAICADTPLR
ncbi:hypothetical protein PVK64_17045 [Aliivibrio sp. S4TY2]|uniref:hypothetical protein n=1 Tax=unclassified Aliivibrio TaxID=2645654 RepID=UPI002378B48B|nr:MULTISPECIES: hypothetical protein [unclassified Aliivibrio]MDD9157876.1 hypothetical protein [Aliivibrio sp. S4TY2]MDD9161907.1 hypothetical protein [Aliivibrio sp. S4TY1]MDD9165876.1 hypothetical protein [Aliivibrio sp. S4MY2]MDD9169875.1 hypothetical protein [Aliivibrio sp. S4MY4]MDD9185492.1 hypothetical protein [Aliivibrio sp. S4MY3]